jgi:hypothetical protein
MKLNIRLKLMASYLVLIMVIGLTLFFFLSHTLDEYMVKETREGLFSEARLTRLIAERAIGDLHRRSALPPPLPGKRGHGSP